ncbi:conserved hypothetical protein, partial [Clostridium carboxidivorans P7]
CGISGDMNLAALLDLGIPKEYLIEELLKLNLDSEYEIKIKNDAKLGITGTRVDVIINSQSINKAEVLHDHNGDHHVHDHIHHSSEEHHAHEHCNHVHISSSTHEHHHRNLKDIENIINSSDLKDNIKKLSLNMFMKVAEAESKVHGKALYEVHFHEVGAIDSIIDIVGAAICLDYLQVDKIIASPVQLGGGFVKCAHGIIPIPAPATVEILKDIPINIGRVSFETTTPTGAAILAANVEKFTEKIGFSIKKVGYGIGHRDLEIPNVLRVYLGEKDNFEE